MKIKKITLNNFGIHRSLEFNTDSKPIIGLLGKNGSGKSTILDAVKYGLTGEIEGKIEDAVTVGAEKGFVELLIDKDGEEIKLKREVGKSSKKELYRNNKKVTSAKDIELAIEDLLAVDKNAMSNACFLKQGSLNELLFGTDSSREKLFIKLVNLSFCEKYAAIIDKKIQSVQSGVEDLQVLLDEVNTQRMDAVANKELLEKELSRTVDFSKILEAIDEHLLITSDLETIESDLQKTTLEVSTCKSELGSIFLGFNVKSRSELETKLQKLREDYEKLVGDKRDLIEQKNIKVKYDKSLEELTSTRKLIDVKKENLNTIELQIKDLILPDINVESISSKLAVITDKLQKRGEWLSLQHRQCEAIDNICVNCGLELKNAPSPDQMEKFREEFERDIGVKFELEDQLKEQKEKYEQYENTKNNLNSTKDILLAELKLLEENFQKVTNNIQELIGGASVEDPSLEITKLSENLESIKSTIQRCESSVSKVIELDTKISTSELLIVGKSKSLNLKYTKIKSIKETINSELVALDMESFIGLDESKLKLEITEQNKSRIEFQGRLKEANILLSNFNTKHSNLKQRVEENKDRLRLVEELKDIKHILSKKGLPRQFIDHKFDKLVNLTSNNLTILNSDFTVTKDTEKFLSFLFERFDGQDHVVLPMNRLSGGQKVRLCIAFLLAVQQELVPEVGFQTFDEPSTHLDEDGVERLCNMFKGLQDLLRCVNHQVWICDHNPLLEESFNKTLRL